MKNDTLQIKAGPLNDDLMVNYKVREIQLTKKKLNSAAKISIYSYYHTIYIVTVKVR